MTVKREGDGGTPRARIAPLAVLVRGALPRRPTLCWRTVTSRDGWCDDATRASYNAHVRLPATGSHERLARDDALYDVIVITDHNRRPRVRGLGSAIFLHVAHPKLTPTAGCLAFSAAAWRRAAVPLGDYLVGIDPRPTR
ncbi:L,D-transpeptidase catalytic domain protein [Acuticoccus sp.]|uniref:L,D-transpeptidase catalytic domain protein n=1 Tax=Acuticoccus sp. TaxID=1904378 RepID=UPI003B51A9F1